MSDTVWVALLRGINVGGHKRMAMSDLRGLFESLGYRDVRTVLQSGNALFTTSSGRAMALEQQIAVKVETELGLDVSVLVRSETQWRSMIDANPFVAQGVTTKELHATFLSKTPSAANVAKLD